MSDLPARLRELHTVFGQAHQVLLEAADRIEELEAVLREHLIDKIADCLDVAPELRGPAKNWKLP